VCVVFEEFLNKNVRIRQDDGFVKFGFLEKIENDFLFLKFRDGKLSMIHRSDISGIEEVEYV
jgi:hypothetical protein